MKNERMSGHSEHHLTSSVFIADIVIGMSDGLTVPFALAAGLSGAVHDSSLIVTAGIAEIVAGSIAMGLGGYLSAQTEIDHYNSELSRESQEVETMPEQEKQEVRLIFEEMGLSPELQLQAVEQLATDKEKWINFMMKLELGLQKPDPAQAGKSAWTISLSYALGGLIPLLPYFFLPTPVQSLTVSSLITLVCLFIFGYFKSKVTGQPPLAGALKVMFTGAAAAAAAFVVARQLG